jgi:hypothetical protein
MAKYVFYYSIGFANAKQREVVDIPDEEIEGLSEDEREAMLEQRFQDWASNFRDFGWWPAEDDE